MATGATKFTSRIQSSHKFLSKESNFTLKDELNYLSKNVFGLTKDAKEQLLKDVKPNQQMEDQLQQRYDELLSK